MRYEQVISGTFLARPNRFIAHCEIDGKVETVHVKNTGRCRELLLPGATVYMERGTSPSRKTGYSLIGVKKGERLVNIDSSAPNKVMHESLRSGFKLPGMKAYTVIRPEVFYGSSRFDFYLEDGEKKAFLEVKGVTLEEDGLTLFPDAPTERGLKHIQELIAAKNNGYLAYAVFIIQMKGVTGFKPNDRTQPQFGEMLVKAQAAGLCLLAYDCLVDTDAMVLSENVSIYL